MMATRISPCPGAATITSAATCVVLVPRMVTAPAPTSTSINVPISSAIPSLAKRLSTPYSFKNASQSQRIPPALRFRDNPHTLQLHFVEHAPRDHQPLNLAGAFADGHQPLIAVDALYREFLAVTVAAMNLDRVEAHLLG